MGPRRIAIVALGTAVTSVTAWALVDLARPAEPAPVPPIVIDEDDSVSGPGGDDPGKTDPGGDGDDPDGSGGTPAGGAEPPAPLPPPAGDGDDDDDDGDDGD